MISYPKSLFILASLVESVFACVCMCMSACKTVSLQVSEDSLSTVQETPLSVCQRISFAHHFIAMKRRHLDAHTKNTNSKLSSFLFVIHFFHYDVILFLSEA